MRAMPLAAALLALIGCSNSDPNTAEVSGSVSIDGEPVAEGSIQFIPVDDTTGPSAGATIRDGRYSITRDRGAAVGRNRVELRAFKSTGRKVQDPTGLPGTLTDERVPAFPPQFNERSTLIRDVRPGSNTFDFNIELKKSP